MTAYDFLLLMSLWVSFVGAVVRIIVTYWALLFVLGMFTTLIAFRVSSRRRAQETCYTYGHVWQNYSDIFDGEGNSHLECERCGKVMR